MDAPPLPGFAIDDVALTSKPTRETKAETVVLRGVSVPLNSDVGGALVTDLARNKERLVNDTEIIEKYDITSDAWAEITQSKAIRLAVNAEHERRTLRGIEAQEAAAKIFMNSPTVMGEILNDKSASPRHRIEASKELRVTAHSGNEKPGADTERVIVTINLGADEKLVFDCGPPKQTRESPDAETDQW
jgi:hypothetical protein